MSSCMAMAARVHHNDYDLDVNDKGRDRDDDDDDYYDDGDDDEDENDDCCTMVVVMNDDDGDGVEDRE